MYFETNKNSRIVNRITPNNKVRTETRYRDWGSDRFAISTDTNNSTKLFIDVDGGELRGGTTLTLDGRAARTLQKLLNKHYSSM